MKVLSNRYELGESIGTGAMGDVYRATDSQSGETVAVKHLKPGLLDPTLDLLDRFRREGQVLRELNHPNIVTLIDVIEQDSNHYLILEYVDGGDLKDLLSKSPSGLPLDQVLQIAIQLADALTRSHFLDIIHRDIKPANVLIDQNDTPRLTDFGVAHIIGDSDLTQEGVLLGTYGYLSPEACLGKRVDARSDIWSFGVLIFELLTGQNPFTGDSIVQVITAILHDSTPDLQEIRPDIPDNLNDLVYRMLEKNHDARIPSIRLVGAEIEAMIKNIDISSQPPKPKAIEQEDPTEFELHSVFSPPQRTTPGSRNNLLAQSTPFVGREEEMNELTRMISDPTIRLITLMAPGGMGKTRLAIETGFFQAKNFEDGVLFVGLDKYGDPEKIPEAIAEAATYKFHSDGDYRAQIVSYLTNKNLFLIMDNYEHIIAGANILAEIIHAAPQLTVLVTSREKLNIDGENLLVIDGMELPKWETPQDALRYSAVQLFMQSATRTRVAFEITEENLSYVARVCHLVQGVPLGILLAAAWVATLTVKEIAEEIQASMDFLESERRDLPERQRSMRAVFDYSWRLLNDEERDGLARMSVFHGGCTRNAAQSISNISIRLLNGLVNKSLLHRDQKSGRFEIHELIRQFSEEILTNLDDVEEIHDNHARYYLNAFAERENDLKGKDQINALNDIEEDFENVRAAWSWAIERGLTDLLLNGLQSAYIYCFIRDQTFTAVELFANILEHDHTAPILQARAVTFYERIIRSMEKRPKAIDDIKTVMKTLENAGDFQGVGLAKLTLGYALLDTSEIEEALSVFKESLGIFIDLEDLYNQAPNLFGIGYAYSILGEHDKSLNYNLRCLEISQQLGDLYGIILTNNNISSNLEERGKYEESLAYLKENNLLSRKLGDKQGVAWSNVSLAIHLIAVGHREKGQKYLNEALGIIEDINIINTSGWVYYVKMIYDAFDEDYEGLKSTLRKLEALPTTRQDFLSGIRRHHFLAEAGVGNMERARDYLPRKGEKLSGLWSHAMLLLNLALIFDHDGHPVKATELLYVALSNRSTSAWMSRLPITIKLKARLKVAVSKVVYSAARENGKALTLEEAVQRSRDEGLF